MIVVAIFLHTIIAAVFSNEKGKRRHDEEFDDEEDSGTARLANFAAMGIFVVIIIIFNIAFWVIALKEFNKGADEIIQERKPIK